MHRRRFNTQIEASSKLNVPFSWEFRPGIPKMTRGQLGSEINDENHQFTTSFALPPPYCTPSHSARFEYSMLECYDKQLDSHNPVCSSFIPLKPAVGSLSYIFGSSLKNKDPEDPFLAALMKCKK
ncbi:hypothetical protein PanWU01x14_115700 [Parasponia andersonii]|uniref:Uncharacterized protein n=1 Tax=Parasponia andersonii TaxID=3476 RepID=A0A2P5CWX8_PARAD|nr:hypothetical protein PanWU01x14_115700 [Parasponia andersonii]